jgi:hypothetical protein
MPETGLAAQPAASVKSPRRRWLVLTLLLLLVVAAAAYLVFGPDASEDDLRQAIAETDRADPGWHFDEVDARRKVIPDDENAALRVMAAHALLPAPWPPQPAAARPGAPEVDRVGEAIASLPPQIRLDDAVARDLRAALRLAEPALVEARKLKSLSVGRYPVTWTADIIGSKLYSQEPRAIAELLEHEALAQAEEGKPAEALATARGVIVAGRSFGDEPLVISLLIRQVILAQAARSIERTLAQGVPAADELRKTQELLEDEVSQPVLLNALRGERGATQRLIDLVKLSTGRRFSQALRSGSGGLRGLLDLNAPQRVRELQARTLRAETECIEAAKLPVEDQVRAFARLRPKEPVADNDIAGSTAKALVKMAESSHRTQSILRCAIACLALERYRSEKGTWPERLDDLAPAYLQAVPLDPYDGRQLRYKRLADGVLVYSIGPDGQDDGGAMNRKNPVAKETDLGFRLWDVNQRRQPSAEVLPPPNEPGQ